MSGPKHTPTVLSGPCPGCNGEPHKGHWDEPYSCPDCAGSGKAENSITANEKLRDAAPRLAAALKRCADIVESYVNAEYPEEFRVRSDYQRQGYERDMEAVHTARAALREAGVES